MNLDLLKKLVRLANNNPNDNEANLAARKVCKMIEEGKLFEGKDGRPLTYNDIHRTAEPEIKSRVYTSNDWFSKWYKEYERDVKEYYERETKNRADDWINGSWDYTRKETKRKRENKRNLQCKTCLQTKETIFEGLPELFECNECQWNAYMRNL